MGGGLGGGVVVAVGDRVGGVERDRLAVLARLAVDLGVAVGLEDRRHLGRVTGRREVVGQRRVLVGALSGEHEAACGGGGQLVAGLGLSGQLLPVDAELDRLPHRRVVQRRLLGVDEQ